VLVRLGRRGGGKVEVLGGLAEGDVVIRLGSSAAKGAA